MRSFIGRAISMAMVTTTLLVLPVGSAFASGLAAGAVDTTFGTSGSTTTTPGSSGYISSIALDSQGRVIAGGEAVINGSAVFAVARYTSSGALDSSFGTSGFTTTTIGTYSFINSIAIDSQGRIIAGGEAVINGAAVFAIARYTSAGALDTTFGTAGITTRTPGTGDYISSIAIDSQGRIVASGFAVINTRAEFTLARYTSSGVLDTTFGTSGFSTSTPGRNDFISSIAIDSQGRIIAGGYATTIGGAAVFALARYTSAGALDTTFGTAGFTTTTPGTSDSISSIAIDGQGRVIVGGEAVVNGLSVFAVGRYTNGGALDTTFGTAGFDTTTPGFADDISSIAIDSQGRIIAGGWTYITGQAVFALGRYTSSGSLDTTFGTSGFTTAPEVTYGSRSSLAIDNQGGIITGGEAVINATNHFALTRYISDFTASVPLPAPAPLQLSKISALSFSSAVSGSALPITISGSFIEKISNIQVNSTMLPVGSWKQTPTSISFTYAGQKPGSYQIQIYNGSAPLMSVQQFTLTVPATLPAPTPIAKATYIHCVNGSHLRIAYGVSPVCAIGYNKQ